MLWCQGTVKRVLNVKEERTCVILEIKSSILRASSNVFAPVRKGFYGLQDPARRGESGES